MSRIKQKPSQSSVRVYSYIRFSTPEQALGGSERRQLEDAKEWAAAMGYQFDTSLRMMDRGLSSFHGDHRKRGALGKFLDAVTSGQVPKGSILVVENIDRLGREGVFRMFKTIIFDLIEHGVTIQTLDPERTYNEESINGHQIYELIVDIQRAYRESEVKSNRRKWSWDKARELIREGKPARTGMFPAWLRRRDDGTFESIPEAADTIRFIYESKLKGISVRTLEVQLNSGAAWMPPGSNRRKTRGWRHSYIRKILQDQSVIGLYQPHIKPNGRWGKRVPHGDPVPRYPAVIPTKLFHAVQARMEQNRGTGGQTGKFANVLRGLAKCAYCGAPMHFIHKGPLPKGGQYLFCSNGRRGIDCDRVAIRYDECEKVVLENCPRLRPEDVLPKPADRTRRCQSLRQRIQGAERELVNIERKLNNYQEQIGDATSREIGNMLQAKMSSVLEQQKELIERKRQDESELLGVEEGQRSFTAWTTGLKELQNELAKGDNPELRIQLNSHLRELILQIEIFAVGHERLSHRSKLDGSEDGERLADRIDAGIGDVAPRFARTKRFREFLKYVTGRRMTREGRFLRVHFKSGSVVDLVPEGSIADGMYFGTVGNKAPRWLPRTARVSELWNAYETEGRSSARCRVAGSK